MLTFSKTSWHYRLTDYAYDNHYTQWNLCKYFWGTIFAIVLVGWTVWIVRNWPDTKWPKIQWPQTPEVHWPSKAPDPSMLFFLLWTAGFGGWGIYSFMIGQLEDGVILVGIPIVAWTGIAAATAYDNWREDHPRKRKPYKAPKPKEPNLMIEYLKAKKGRFCPIITFIDEELR